MSDDKGAMQAPWSGVLSGVRDVAFAAAIYLFFCGYVFRSEYYRSFGLPSSASLADSATFFVYSYRVFADEPWLCLGLVVAAAIAWACIRRRLSQYARYVTLATCAVFLFPVLAIIASLAANGEAAQYKNWNSSDGTLTLGIKKNAHDSFNGTSGQVFLNAIDNHEMRLFAMTGTMAYITDRKYTPEGEKANLLVYVVPLDEVSHMEINLPEVSK